MDNSRSIDILINARTNSSYQGEINRVSGDLKTLRRQSLKTLKSFAKTGLAAGGLSAALGSGALIAYGKEALEAAKSADSLATAVGVSRQSLQEWQYAGKRVGLEADGVADILKDVGDKMGDLAITDGGAAIDVFEKLNLDINQFKQLSPDEALLKMASAMDSASLTQNEKTFLFESLGSDLTLLEPLLRNNAEKLRELRNEAKSSGAVLNNIEFDRLKQANIALDRLAGQMQGLGNQSAQTMAHLAESLDISAGIEAIRSGWQTFNNDLREGVYDIGNYRGATEGLTLAITAVAVHGLAPLATQFAATTAASVKNSIATLKAAAASRTAAAADTARAATQARANALVTAATLNEAKAHRANVAQMGIYGPARAAAERQVTAAAAAHALATNSVTLAEGRAAAAMRATTAQARIQAVAMKATAGAARLASGALALVGGPVGAAVLAGVAAWQLYHSELLEVRVAGIVMTQGLLEGFENLKFGVGAAWAAIRETGQTVFSVIANVGLNAYENLANGVAFVPAAFEVASSTIKSAWAGMMGWLTSKFSAFLEKVAGGMSRLDFLGKPVIEAQVKVNNLATSMRSFSLRMKDSAQNGVTFTEALANQKTNLTANVAALRDAIPATGDFTAAQDKLLQTRDKNIASIRKITGEMVDDAGAKAANKEKTDELAKAMAGLASATETTTETTTEGSKAREHALDVLRDAQEALKYETILRDEGEEAARKYELQLDKLTETEAKEVIRLEAQTEAIQEQNAARKKAEDHIKDLQQELKIQTVQLNEGADAARALELGFEGYTNAQSASVIATEKQIESLEMWGDINTEIHDGLTDAVTQFVTTGEGKFKDLADIAKNIFSKMVINPVIQAVMSPISSSITSMLMPSAASAAGAGGGMGFSPMSLLSNASSLSGITGMATNYGASLLSGAGSQQAAMLAAQTGSFGTGGALSTLSSGQYAAMPMNPMLSSAAAGIAGYGLTQKYGAGAGILGGALTMGGTAGISSMLAGGTFMAGAAPALMSNPVGWAVLAAGVLAGALLKDDDSPRVHLVGDNKLAQNDGLYHSSDAAQLFGDFFQEAGKQQQNFSSNNPFGSLNAAAHGTHDIGDPGDQMLINMLAADERIGQSIAAFSDTESIERIKSEFADFEHTGVDSIEETFQARVKTMSEAMPPMLRNLVDWDSDTQLITQRLGYLGLVTHTTAPLLNRFGFDLGEVGAQITANAVALTDYAGGIDALQASMNYYYQEFFSEEEKSQAVYARAGGEVLAFNQLLGLSGDSIIDTHQEFRAYMESLDTDTEVGQQMFEQGRRVMQSVDMLADTGMTLDEVLAKLPEDMKVVALDVADNNALMLNELKTQKEAMQDTINGLIKTIAALTASAQSAATDIAQAASDVDAVTFDAPLLLDE